MGPHQAVLQADACPQTPWRSHDSGTEMASDCLGCCDRHLFSFSSSTAVCSRGKRTTGHFLTSPLWIGNGAAATHRQGEQNKSAGKSGRCDIGPYDLGYRRLGRLYRIELSNGPNSQAQSQIEYETADAGSGTGGTARLLLFGGLLSRATLFSNPYIPKLLAANPCLSSTAERRSILAVPAKTLASAASKRPPLTGFAK